MVAEVNPTAAHTLAAAASGAPTVQPGLAHEIAPLVADMTAHPAIAPADVVALVATAAAAIDEVAAAHGAVVSALTALQAARVALEAKMSAPSPVSPNDAIVATLKKLLAG
jgi:hypothetical protein